ncbi:MAG: TlpA family protein disulfide reductase [Candidatus Brocadiaceae bacterium]|nr:TlpA family protein disulfide reductase [Candidatus Brocadiaceae bacterium]
MKKRTVFLFTTVIMVLSTFWKGYPIEARELQHDTTAAKQLEFIRRNLTGLQEMKFSDARQYFEVSLKDLTELEKNYAGTHEALEATFYKGTVYIQFKSYDKAVHQLDTVLKQEGLNENFKARALYFKTQALIGKGDLEAAKKTVVELRKIEPRAANAFKDQLNNIARVGMEAPTFKEADITGKLIDLAEYKGNITIIYFWATWCDPCIQEFPKVKKIYYDFKGKGIRFIGVSLDDDIRDVQGFVQHEGVEWPQIFDGKRWDGKLPSLYFVQAIPTLFVLDREGRIRYIGNDTKSISRIAATLLTESAEVPLFR